MTTPQPMFPVSDAETQTMTLIQQMLEPASDWHQALAAEFASDELRLLDTFLAAEEAAGKNIFPPLPQRLNALNSTPLAAVRVVILGQDPYPTPGHAHGLSFSVQPQVSPLPKSLQNIYRELKEDLGIEPENGHLQSWADQGVLLLNAVLSVEEGKAGSHAGKGWERFTDAIIDAVNQREAPAVFMLWGKQAQKKGQIIDAQRHCVIASPHPSPLSAYRGFFGSRPFSRANAALKSHGFAPIDWDKVM